MNGEIKTINKSDIPFQVFHFRKDLLSQKIIRLPDNGALEVVFGDKASAKRQMASVLGSFRRFRRLKCTVLILSYELVSQKTMVNIVFISGRR